MAYGQGEGCRGLFGAPPDPTAPNLQARGEWTVTEGAFDHFRAACLDGRGRSGRGRALWQGNSSGRQNGGSRAYGAAAGQRCRCMTPRAPPLFPPMPLQGGRESNPPRSVPGPSERGSEGRRRCGFGRRHEAGFCATRRQLSYTLAIICPTSGPGARRGKSVCQESPPRLPASPLLQPALPALPRPGVGAPTQPPVPRGGQRMGKD